MRNHDNECDCAECKEVRTLRLAARDATLNASGKRANQLLKAKGFRFMSRGKPVATVLPERIPHGKPCGNPRIGNTFASKPLSKVERCDAKHENLTVRTSPRYRIAANGAVINGYEARYEDKTISEIATKSYNVKG